MALKRSSARAGEVAQGWEGGSWARRGVKSVRRPDSQSIRVP